LKHNKPELIIFIIDLKKPCKTQGLQGCYINKAAIFIFSLHKGTEKTMFSTGVCDLAGKGL
jgi:hypothetical protein